MFCCWGHAMSQIHICFFALSPRTSWVFLSLWFCVDGIQNPTHVFLTVPCSHRSFYRPYHHWPVRIPLAKRLPWSLLLYYALTSSYYFPRPCIQQQDVQWIHLFCDILYSVSWTDPLTAFHDLVSFICSSIVIIENVLAQPEMTFVFLFLLELALLFLCLVVFHSPWFHCFLKTSLHFPPHWFPFSLSITSSPSLINFSSKCNLTPTSSIGLNYSTTIAFSSLIVSLHAASIHQLVNLAM